MREISRIYGEEAKKLQDDETNLIVKKDLVEGREVAIIYVLGQND